MAAGEHEHRNPSCGLGLVLAERRLLTSGDATATALARDLPITRQGIAKHLAVLQRAGLVEATRTGREVRFTVREDRLDQATRRMAQILTRWDARLAAIKRIAETEP